VPEQRATCVREARGVTVPGEQLLAQLALEQEHGLAHGRLRFPEVIRGFGEAAATHDGGESREPPAIQKHRHC
jgi:hypothetical protein